VKKAFDAFAFAAAAVFALAVVAVAGRNSHFFRDDFAGFFLARSEPLWRVLATPIDVHFVPLHRLVNQLVYSLAPLDFGVALAVLLFFHAAAVATLHATLRALKDSPSNRVLVFLYATNVYLGVLFLWWTSGLHRLPYVALALATLYQYLAYRRAGRSRSLVGAWICFVAALGFYTKAALIPAVMLGMEICLLRDTAPWQRLRNGSVIAGFVVTSALYVALTRSLVASQFSQLHLDPGFLLAFELRSFAVLAAGVFGDVSRAWLAPANFVFIGAWLGFAAYTIARAPWNAVVWGVGIALVALNFGFVAVSQRTASYGLSLAATPRYYFELMFLVVLFVGMALHNLPARPPLAAFEKHPGRKVAATAVACGMLLATAAVSFARFEGLLDTRRYRRNRDAKVFIDNLRADLEALRSRPQREFAFVDGLVPGYLTGKTAHHVRRYSEFLETFDFEARFDPAAPTLYAITEEGHVRPVVVRKAR
jgi:hypothetical protein